MKRTIFALILVLAVSVMGNAAFADTIQFSTSGVFNISGPTAGGNGSSQVAICETVACSTGIYIRFTGASGSYNVPPVAGASLGSIAVAGFDGTGGATNATGTFTLTISQTAPTGGTGTLSANVSGSFVVNGGSGSLVFNQNSVQIGAVTYALNNGLNNNIQINAAGDNGNFGTESTIEAQVSTPEPASLALLGSGMLMGGSFIRRKIRGV